MNKIFLSGVLVQEPEFSEAANGTEVCKLRLSVPRGYKNERGNLLCDYFNVYTYYSTAVRCNKYLKKGDKAYVVGSIQNREIYKEGKKIILSEVVASSVEFTEPEEQPVDTAADDKRLPLERLAGAGGKQ